jgi:hypothetical protein
MYSCLVATEKQFFNILEKNSNITGLLEFNPSMYDYRLYTKWAFMDNSFDIVYVPAVSTQIHPANWLNGKYACYLGQIYANACNVQYGKQFINTPNVDKFNLPQKYITINSQTRQDPKDYDHIQEVVDKIVDIKKVQVGGAKDKPLKNVDLNLCGQTTYQEAASVIKGASLHVGMDSFLMHLAIYSRVESVIVFGGTLPEAAINPTDKHLVHIIEPEDRGLCSTSCHLINCHQKEQKIHDKCINNISVETVVSKIGEVLGEEHIVKPEPIKISSYMIIKDGIKYRFPFEEAINAARRIADEVIVVDGGSTDGTWEKLQEFEKFDQEDIDNQNKLMGVINKELKYKTRLKICQHEWDMDNPTLFGDEKTYARQQCTGTHLIQLDADEIITEPYPGAIRKLIEDNRHIDVIDLPCINFYGDTETIRVETGWKWRISRNDSNIIHGVHSAARVLDEETMKLTMDKKISDGCEMIYANSLEICKHKMCFPLEYLRLNEMVKFDSSQKDKYIEELKKVTKTIPTVFHYSWLNLDTKVKRGEFWDGTHHAKKSWTHSTTKDVEERVKENKDILIKIDIDHPLRYKSNEAK